MRFGAMLSQIGRPVNVREALTGRSARWIAQHFGVSLRQAQRYKSGQTQLDRPQDKAKKDRIMRSADAGTRRKVAAQALRNAQAAYVGRVEVSYPGGRVGGGSRRNLGVVQFGAGGRAAMNAAADALEAGDVSRAERLVSDALLRSDYRHYGPLEIADWPPVFHLI